MLTILGDGRPRKLKLVVSDFHLGKGPYRDDGSVNVFEDFRQDGKFAQFLDYHSRRRVAGRRGGARSSNGDFFNLLSVDLDGRMQEAITERVSVEKTEAILRGHPQVFDALARFAADGRRNVTFIMGNHDPGLLFDGRAGRPSRAGSRGTHRFMLDAYDFDGVHVEHGMQREPMNAFNPNRYFARAGRGGVPEPAARLALHHPRPERGEGAAAVHRQGGAVRELLPLGDLQRPGGGAPDHRALASRSSRRRR